MYIHTYTHIYTGVKSLTLCIESVRYHYISTSGSSELYVFV